MTLIEYLDASTIVRLAECRLAKLVDTNGNSDQILAVHQIIAEAKEWRCELLDHATADERRMVSIALAGSGRIEADRRRAI